MMIDLAAFILGMGAGAICGYLSVIFFYIIRAMFWGD